MPAAEEALFAELRAAGSHSAAADAFAGVHLCVTGFEQDDRELMSELVLAMGGQYSSELARGICTHLVVAAGSAGARLRPCAAARPPAALTRSPFACQRAPRRSTR